MMILKLLAGLWSFILGSLRIVLFLSCLVMLLGGSLSIVFRVFTYEFISGRPGLLPLPWLVYESFGLVVLALIGCYASFYRHHPTLKTFSSLNLLYILYMVAMILWIMPPSDMVERNSEFREKLKEAMPRYNWRTSGDTSNPANKLWDKTQRLMCCGLDGPSDWDIYRPTMTSFNSLPSSCCIKLTKGICDKNNDIIFQTGCMDTMKELQSLDLIVYVFLIGLLMFLSLMSCTIANFNLDRFNKEAGERPTQQTSTATVSRGSGNHNYSRFHNQDHKHEPTPNEPSSPGITDDKGKLIDFSSGPPGYEN